ncbi:hypothetical protein KM043_009521 [Ampulex compressa]|nr:hypothetical protein KM043_009521 [Ampulex compressa]
MFEVNILACISIHVLCLNAFFWTNTTAEWIHMPQFSDEEKIYRIPSAKQEQFYKFSRPDLDDRYSSDSKNGGKINNDVEIVHVFDNESRKSMQESTEKIVEEELFLVPIKLPEPNSTLAENKKDNQKQINRYTRNEDEDEIGCYRNESVGTKNPQYVDYLPIDILKHVHRTLKTQPKSVDGKMRFLKTFERTLMAQIESRFEKMIAGNRRKRGTSEHYDHGYEEHEEHNVGFPSIEGSLMAISFLTFAVYLVRLVMLLFRNMNNPSPAPPTGATLLVGRKKRSGHHAEDEAIRILNGINNFASNF